MEAYPVILTKVKPDNYLVTVPDFHINTEGSSIADAIFMARDAISLAGISLQDLNKPVPAPSAIHDITSEHPSDIVTLVDVDFPSYRIKLDGGATA